ncbi:MAG: thioesterase [Planctomycetes bacterium]|nr:thioesterase [Planctomycetota bacterium]
MMSTSSNNTRSAIPKITLFCLPFSGGNTYSYREFEEHKAEFVQTVAIDLPGHGKRFGQPLLTNIYDMADDVFQQIQNRLNKPYAIYGHSLGAILGYLVSHKIANSTFPMPLHLFVSGRQGPAIPSKMKDMHLLPREEFIDKLMAYGGIPRVVEAEKELMYLFVPIIRADFQAISEFKHENVSPLDVPITVMIGLDEDITYEEALEWQEETNHPLSVNQFPGNHFFIFDHLPEIGRIISQTLKKTLNGNAP